jgi:hypothetical protein
MTRNIYERTRQPLAELNATLAHSCASVDNLTRKTRTARLPFVLWSRRGDFIARYGSLETLAAAARRREELIGA